MPCLLATVYASMKEISFSVMVLIFQQKRAVDWILFWCNPLCLFAIRSREPGLLKLLASRAIKQLFSKKVRLLAWYLQHTCDVHS